MIFLIVRVTIKVKVININSLIFKYQTLKIKNPNLEYILIKKMIQAI